MIPRSPQGAAISTWQNELRSAYRDPHALLDALGIAQDEFILPAAAHSFPFQVTRAYASRMRHGDPRDPLLLQVMPQAAEDADVAGYSADPVGEFELAAAQPYLHKYAGRALLVMTASCAINCRYCFRREFPYRAASGQTTIERAIDAIGTDPNITEVILSGGDPLMLSDQRLASVLERLDTIAHLRRLRLHSRLPVVLPARLTPHLLDLLGDRRVPTVLVIHANHAREIDSVTAAALKRVRAAGITVLNQAVLLRGVNDDAAVLAALCERLFEADVLPYYVHLLDRVRGTAHFEVDAVRALELESSLRARLPGYLVPRFVREVAGAASKLPQQA